MRSLLALASLTCLTGATDLEVLEKGHYSCALPGDATSLAFQPMGEHDFEVRLGSSYVSALGEGTYLLTKDRLVFTSGPFKGQRFNKNEGGIWRQVGEDNRPGRLSCARTGPSI